MLDIKQYLPKQCTWCPRLCGANRRAGEVGICGASDSLRVARADLHFWEEPPLSGTQGSGAVFFSYCGLACVYCQNHRIVAGSAGADISLVRLSDIFLELQERGALNINVVTPTHYAPLIAAAVYFAKDRGLNLPVVWNTSGYETVQAIRDLNGIVDVYLADFKYGNRALAQAYSRAADYPEVALEAISEMVEQVGTPLIERKLELQQNNGGSEGKGESSGESESEGINESNSNSNSNSKSNSNSNSNSNSSNNNNSLHNLPDSFEEDSHYQPILTKGVLVRHLLLPSHVEESKQALEMLCKNFNILFPFASNTTGETNGDDRSKKDNGAGGEARGEYHETRSDVSVQEPGIILSLMNQYTPVLSASSSAAKKYPHLLRSCSAEEYEELLSYADTLDIPGYFWQQGDVAKESFIPKFDLCGVLPIPQSASKNS